MEEGEVIGFSYAYVLPRFQHTELLIYSVDVHEGHRRSGVGRALIERLKTLCADRGWAAMWVLTNESNAPAMALYQSAGGVRPNPDDVMFDFRA